MDSVVHPSQPRTLLFCLPSSTEATLTPPYFWRLPRCIRSMSHRRRNSVRRLYVPQKRRAPTAVLWYSRSSLEFDLRMSRTARYDSHRNLRRGRRRAESRWVWRGSADMVERRRTLAPEVGPAASRSSASDTAAAASETALVAAPPASARALASRQLRSAESRRWRMTISREPGALAWLRLRYWWRPSLASRALLRPMHRSRYVTMIFSYVGDHVRCRRDDSTSCSRVRAASGCRMDSSSCALRRAISGLFA
mmetsp:Transcript_14507/g.41745  ORF Transcript_14507/g.41745 Transcript_14507/m.41745 type:complete len:252 (-) Transcript_14507:153-908(-)